VGGREKGKRKGIGNSPLPCGPRPGWGEEEGEKKKERGGWRKKKEGEKTG